ncbi:NADH-FMN oxidoreductase RutF, flavin reductase (DIM6/NTAB) family [Parafrankia irregularis]|uniref:NADH-FMN oxidoreductase RutF, flavin reductase (DIM6/NTAB) family n=1 Tax=Parafrankia irregularis TaxID=795642 RepID=A0A0S4QRF8_9ACTN|nr:MULTISPECIES: flavin reductase family protein [Parafrankia]MBE3204507.1 flavin reductase [Parafrankia sp. CH37]CUU57785.1 NADH-FMN oxidoreductase RutF, flavin reductase (DIM6/NTAB) family [Parafrankia irregularis]
MPPELSAFHDAVSAISYPMAVVTTTVNGERSGCLVGFHTQCSIDPPRYLVCVSHTNHTFGLARHARHLAVHLLDITDRALAELFGEETGDKVDKFAHCRWLEGPFGLPVLADPPAWFAGPVLSVTEVGDHSAFVIDPAEGTTRGPLHQLAFQDVRGMRPGHPA